MLVITRRINEELHIGEDVTVKVLGTNGYNVRLGIEAPLDVLVDRSEIRERRKINPDNIKEKRNVRNGTN